jgi:hypothetical protein
VVSIALAQKSWGKVRFYIQKFFYYVAFFIFVEKMITKNSCLNIFFLHIIKIFVFSEQSRSLISTYKRRNANNNQQCG